MRALIIGASGAVGGAVARELSARGAQLALHGRDEARLASLSSQIGATTTIVADLTAPGAPERVVAAAADALGGLDVSVCAVGVVAFGPTHELTDATLVALLEVNLHVPVRLTRALAARMERGATIVNISAIVAEMPTAGMAAYSASKAALTAFDRASGRELRREGIRVIDVRPPHLATGLETRPIAGRPPTLPAGQDPAAWARVIADAIEEPGRTEVGSEG